MDANKLATPEEKTYFSRVPGSKYTFADGYSITFDFGRFKFDPKKEEYQDPFFAASMNGNPPNQFNGFTKAVVYFHELESLVKSPNPLIFLQGTNPDVKLPDEINPMKNAKSETEIAQSDAKLLGSGRAFSEVGEVNKGPNSSNPNESTIDPDLRARIFSERDTGAASNAERIRQEAQNRLQTQNANTPGGMAN